MRTDRRRVDDASTYQCTDDQGYPPLLVARVTVQLKVVGARQHQRKQNQNRYRTRIDENLHDSDKFGIEQQVDTGSHRKHHHQC